MQGGGDIEIPDIEQPNFETIATGIENVSGGLNAIRGELERFANLQPVQQGQQIQEINQTLRLILQVIERNHVDITTRITAINTRITAIDNSNIQLRNRLNNVSNPSANILPLRHPQTGNFIENCPTTFAQINRLSAIEATRILRILGVPIPSTLALKREAVRLQFL